MARHQHFVIADQDLVDEPGLGDRSAICAGCSSEWVRALGACGMESVERPELDS